MSRLLGPLAGLVALSGVLVWGEVRTLSPDWSSVKPPYVEEPVTVQIDLDRSGIPIAFLSDEPLPDPVVRSIQQVRVDDPRFLGKSIRVPVLVRRSLADGREELLAPFWFVNAEPLDALTGKDLSAGEAASLEREAVRKDDPRVLTTLLGYYTLSSRPNVESAKRRRAQIIDWFVRNSPDSSLLGTPLALINTREDRLADQTGFDRVAIAWREAVSAHPESAKVLEHAVNFLAIPDGNSALRIIQRSPNWGARMRWAGQIYAWRASGAVSVSVENGSVRKEPAMVDESARNILLKTDRTDLVLSAMWTLAQAPLGSSEFCAQLLGHTRQLYPDTRATCPSAATNADLEIESPKIRKKVQPALGVSMLSRLPKKPISFELLIDEAGLVTDVEFVSGPLVLYDGVRQAAEQWTFAPLKIAGRPAPATAGFAWNLDPPPLRTRSGLF